MPYDPNPNWTARTNAAAKAPVYYVAIEGLTTKHFSTAPVRASATTKKILLKVPDSVAQKLFQLQGRASLNLISFELIDRDGEVTDLIATEKASPTFGTLINRAVTLYSGYMDLEEADYAPVGFGQISDVDMTDNGLAVRFRLADLKRHQFEDICTNADAAQSIPYGSSLAADVAVGAMSVVVTPAGTVSEDDNLFLGPSSNASYTGQEEKVTVDIVSGSTLYLKVPTTKAFKAGDEVRWATTVIQGNPINLIYALWTGDFASSTFPLTKKRGAPTGLGIDVGNIDTAKLQKERDRGNSPDVWEFELKEPIPGFKFLEQRIFALIGYPTVGVDGKLGFRMYRPAWPDDAAAGLPAILKADVLRWRWRRAHDLHVNKVRLGLDLDLEKGEPAARVTVEDAADQASTKETASLEHDDTGYRTALEGQRIAEGDGAILLRRFVKPPAELELLCHLTKRALQVGEDISVTHEEIPNILTGARGLTAVRMEIIGREERFAAGEIRFTVSPAPYTRPAYIAPDAGGSDDYDTATAADKEYLYIAPDAGNFADGGSAYEIG